MSKKHIPVKTQHERNAQPTDSDHEAPAAEPLKPATEGDPEVGSEQPPAAEDIARVREELDAAKDRALRFQAELENYRRRVAREMEQERRYAGLSLLRDLLPVWDNVNRAIEAAERAGGGPGLLQGFKMVAEQIEDVLRRHECVKIDALHQPFDPNLHEAITQQPSDEHLPGTVLGETQTGFRLHDRVVRPSQVIVSCAPPGSEAKQSD